MQPYQQPKYPAAKDPHAAARRAPEDRLPASMLKDYTTQTGDDGSRTIFALRQDGHVTAFDEEDQVVWRSDAERPNAHHIANSEGVVGVGHRAGGFSETLESGSGETTWKQGPRQGPAHLFGSTVVVPETEALQPNKNIVGSGFRAGQLEGAAIGMRGLDGTTGEQTWVRHVPDRADTATVYPDHIRIGKTNVDPHSGDVFDFE